MNNNELLLIVLAFIVGYMCGGGRLIEGKSKANEKCTIDKDCIRGHVCSTSRRNANNIVYNIVPHAIDLLEKLLDKLNIEYKCVPKTN